MNTPRFKKLFDQIETLSASKLLLIERAVERFAARIETTVAANAPPFNQMFADAFGDSLQTHHSMSKQNLGKDRFEYALIEAFEKCKVPAEPAKSRTNKGHDVTVAGVRWSLKSQGNDALKADEVWISKFMELGKGKWASIADMEQKREKFLEHLTRYDRIFSLRHWEDDTPLLGSFHYYELIEIPKALLQEVKNWPITFAKKTKQETTPAYCKVGDGKGGCKFELYFDAGGERKLQVRHIKITHCKRIASWKFPT